MRAAARWLPWLILPLALLIAAAVLLIGWWWAVPVAGLLTGLAGQVSRRRAFSHGFLAALLAWLALLAWRALAWRGLAQLAVVAALARLPTVAGIAFALVPALITALAAGLLAVAAWTLARLAL